ncbi:MAG: NAD(+) diphosphatase [Bacteroidaceae bacterium]|nr:NAD(+) diphosphatase [Bacteroidaceae bacterium]
MSSPLPAPPLGECHIPAASPLQSTPPKGERRGGRYFLFCQGDILLTKEGTIPCGDTPPIELKPWERVTELQGGQVVIVSLSHPVTDREDLQMMPLRKSFHVLSAEDYQLAGKCAELVYFHQNSKFCGVCGGEMRWQTEISKQCKECGKELWPSLATAIIVRVTRGDEILMVHAHTFRDRHYGLVAGFVETGETLEECVQREVWEETHLRVTNIRYFASQPWPYPSGLMVGFTADYLSGEIELQKTELSDGGWYKRDNLPYLPDPSSIAYRLIMDWVK